jgi:uncharacterized membrane protein YgcG
MRGFDFTTWSGALSALVGIALFALVGIGLRLLVMMTLQRRRERLNRQINERLRTLIAAYKVLGGSFTGTLVVSPSHLRDLRDPEAEGGGEDDTPFAERARRIRDAVEAALSDIILLGTEEQVRLAARAARDLAENRPIRTDELVASLRSFVRTALDLEPVPEDVEIPQQGPTRPGAGASGRGGREGARAGGGGRGGGGGGGAGVGTGLGMGLGRAGDDQAPPGG